MEAKKKKFWMWGMILSAVGIILVRFVSEKPELGDYRIYISSIGVFIALSGLLVITFGYRKRIK